MRLYTVGHGTTDAVSFAALLNAAGVRQVLDVRTKPGSQRFPWFGRAELEQWLPAAGIAYAWEPALGGFRSPRPESPNVALRSRAFRGYADHMAEPDFTAGFRRVLDALEGPDGAVAVMCSESLWWKCHRRLIADTATLLHGLEVLHLSHDGRVVPHQLTEAARPDATRRHLVYDAATDQLALGFTNEP